LIRTALIIERMLAAESNEPFDESAFEHELDHAVQGVVKKQVEVGIDVPSDGEYGKRGWTQYVTERLGGLEQVNTPNDRTVAATATDADRFGDFYREHAEFERTLWLPREIQEKIRATRLTGARAPGWHVTGPISYVGQEAVQRDIRNFKAALSAANHADGFLPVVAPCSVTAGRANDFYKTEEEYLFAVADALSVEYHAIADAGITLQVDDAFLPLAARGRSLGEFQTWAAVRQEALNSALKGIPPEQIRYHICWGSQNHPHLTDIPLRDLVDVILQVNAGSYVIESANPRHEHEWKVWGEVSFPAGKKLVPGVVGHATNIVEHPELVAQRLENFASVLGAENLMAGTDCGFSQNWNLIRVHETIQWAKLEALVEGAEIASKRLFS
jgi:5-methyltetrahydropteroyltriglutamate--homocysteine methyltransferase